MERHEKWHQGAQNLSAPAIVLQLIKKAPAASWTDDHFGRIAAWKQAEVTQSTGASK